jgi:glycosyltransferase involved in cell wall biosynthesis
LVVMSERGRRILREVYAAPEQKVAVIPHGIPDLPFVDPNFYKDQFGVAGRPMMLTFGLLSPGKGIEHGIEALPAILARHPDLVYVILGATHQAGEDNRNVARMAALLVGLPWETTGVTVNRLCGSGLEGQLQFVPGKARWVNL